VAPPPGRLVGIFLAPTAEGPVEPQDAVRAVPGRGLEGDRYYLASGTYSGKDGPDREVTLIEAEAVEAARRDEGIDIRPEQTRRNLVTRGVALNHLVDQEFSVGEVRLRGIRLCEPCLHMERLSGVVGARKALVHRGGLRAQILVEGVIRAGDQVQIR
jgi:MOSC domain-containing protein YiiM